jgi:formate/nitrite transporter FocA (FNT family)
MYEENKILGPDGHEIIEHANSKTTRSILRTQEDNEYVPVIIKRIDESTRHPDDILENAISHGLIQYERSDYSLLLSSISAGLIIGFAGMCVALMSHLFPLEESFIANRLAIAFVYPLGFIVCIMSGSQLFTEQTASAVYPVLDKKVHYRLLLKNWGIVLVGNIIGTFSSAILLFLSDPVIQANSGYIEVASHLTHFTFGQIFISAVLAGWLMAQGGWLVLASSSSGSQILCIFIVTFIIGFGGLHHSIAGSSEIFGSLLHSENPNYFGSFKFLTSSILGNLVGGSFFVGILNYSHIRKLK